MFKFLKTFRHLKAEEVINLLDGVSLPEARIEHAATCSDCRTTLASLTEMRQVISDVEVMDIEAADAAVASADWLELRSSVRNRLLARAVKRSSVLQRWTGWTLRPAASWSLALMILLSGMTAGGLWHYQTVHLNQRTDETTGVSQANGVDSSLADSALEFGLFVGDAEAAEAEALAWSRTEIFTTLNELEVDEEEVLRELISVAFVEDSIFDTGAR